MSKRSAMTYFFPESEVGGYTHIDGTVDFYSRVNALLAPDMTVLDLGAGRGAQIADGTSPWRNKLQKLQGKCRHLIGADVDPVVRTNPYLDEAIVIGNDGRVPVDDASIDLIYSDWVLEHVDEPRAFASEIARILKTGGWLCARTPNRWGYIGLGTNLIPNRFHVGMLKFLQPSKKAEDTFPTRYKLNTKRRLHEAFPSNTWDVLVYSHTPEPTYFGNSKFAWALVILVMKFLPAPFAPVLHVFARKK